MGSFQENEQTSMNKFVCFCCAIITETCCKYQLNCHFVIVSTLYLISIGNL